MSYTLRGYVWNQKRNRSSNRRLSRAPQASHPNTVASLPKAICPQSPLPERPDPAHVSNAVTPESSPSSCPTPPVSAATDTASPRARPGGPRPRLPSPPRWGRPRLAPSPAPETSTAHTCPPSDRENALPVSDAAWSSRAKRPPPPSPHPYLTPLHLRPLCSATRAPVRPRLLPLWYGTRSSLCPKGLVFPQSQPPLLPEARGPTNSSLCTDGNSLSSALGSTAAISPAWPLATWNVAGPTVHQDGTHEV